MKIWRSLYYHYIHLYRLGLLGSINESIHLQYANTAIPSVYTNRNTHRNFSQKSENHIPLLRLRIFSSLTSFSSSLQGIAQANLALLSLFYATISSAPSDGFSGISDRARPKTLRRRCFHSFWMCLPFGRQR